MAVIRFLMVILLGFSIQSSSVLAQDSSNIAVAESEDGALVKSDPRIDLEKNSALGDTSKIIQAPTVSNTAKPSSSNAPKKIPSLFFTYWQHQSIIGAMRARGKGVNAYEAEFDAGAETPEDKGVPKPEKREVYVSGIVYVHAKDWTVWLNGMRLTPNAVPSEVVDIKVFKDYIDLKWHDKYTNKIFPIRLRAHQRFNLDSRVFLPG